MAPPRAEGRQRETQRDGAAITLTAACGTLLALTHQRLPAGHAVCRLPSTRGHANCLLAGRATGRTVRVCGLCSSAHTVAVRAEAAWAHLPVAY